MKEIFEAIEFYDFKKLEGLQQKWSKVYFDLWVKFKKAKEIGDEKSLAKIEKSLQNHRRKTDIIKEKASAIGIYWM